MGTAPKIVPALPAPMPTVNQPTALGEGFLWRWSVANGIGGCLGLPLMVLVIGFGIYMIVAASPTSLPPPFTAAVVAVVGVGAGAFGGAVGVAQWLVLRRQVSGWWPIVMFTVATALGAVAGLIFVILVPTS